MPSGYLLTDYSLRSSLLRYPSSQHNQNHKSYHQSDNQKSALTSFLEEKEIDFDYEEPRATPNEYLKLLENRIDEIKCNPESAGSSFNDFDKKMRAKYGF